MPYKGLLGIERNKRNQRDHFEEKSRACQVFGARRLGNIMSNLFFISIIFNYNESLQLILAYILTQSSWWIKSPDQPLSDLVIFHYVSVSSVSKINKSDGYITSNQKCMQVLKLEEGKLTFFLVTLLRFPAWGKKKKKGNHYPTEIGFIILASLGRVFCRNQKAAADS